MSSEEAWLTREALESLGFASLGRDVKVSRLASIHKASAISLGNHVRIDDFCVLTGGEGIVIGERVHLGCFCALLGGAGIEMEAFSTLSSRVNVFSESDDYSGGSMTNPTVPDKYRSTERGRVTIGRHAIVGAASTLLPGVRLGEGVAVGAHTLVNKDCEPWWVYVGVPARKLRARSRALLELEHELLEDAHNAGPLKRRD